MPVTAVPPVKGGPDPRSADPVPAPGRRERKKVQTREALRTAAHQLFAEKGFAHTTVDDITDAADVSRRTFFRYYDSKEDLLRVDVADLLPELTGALAARPLTEPPLESVLAALGCLAGPGLPATLAVTMAGAETGFRARMAVSRLLMQWEQGIADTLLRRWGADPGAPGELRARADITAAAATSALRSAIQIYRSRHPGPGLDPAELPALVRQAFRLVAAGCPVPDAPPAPALGTTGPA